MILMSKRALIEILIAALLLIVEIIVVLVCRFGEALNAVSVDSYMTAVIVIFINIDMFYIIALQIINSNWKNK